MSPSPGRNERDERTAAAMSHAAALARAQAAEAAEAGAMLRRFVADAQAAGIAPLELRAIGYGGRHLYRTGITGWYLRRDCTVGVGTDARYFILKVPDSLRGRFSTVPLEPSDPPLIVGKGGRDGEAIDLRDLLALRLAAGNTWPTP